MSKVKTEAMGQCATEPNGHLIKAASHFTNATPDPKQLAVSMTLSLTAPKASDAPDCIARLQLIESYCPTHFKDTLGLSTDEIVERERRLALKERLNNRTLY